MTYLAGLRKVNPSDRLYDIVNNIAVHLDALAVAGEAVLKKQLSQPFTGEKSGVQSAQFPSLWVTIPVGGPFWVALTPNAPARSYEIRFESFPSLSPSSGGTDVGTGLHTLQQLVFTAAFLIFYERHRPWFQKAYTQDIEKWPELFRFAWAIRNAVAHHEGKINISDPRRRRVVWHNLSYDHNDCGKNVIGPDISAGDILILLFEMSDELDRIGCPIHP